MSTTSSACLFYGYVRPYDEEQGEYEETSWDKNFLNESHGCTIHVYGFDERLGSFLSVNDSYKEAKWDDAVLLLPDSLFVKEGWNEQLQNAAHFFDLDITGLNAQWHLVCLYF
jgi:hypothetical protein